MYGCGRFFDRVRPVAVGQDFQQVPYWFLWRFEADCTIFRQVRKRLNRKHVHLLFFKIIFIINAETVPDFTIMNMSQDFLDNLKFCNCFSKISNYLKIYTKWYKNVNWRQHIKNEKWQNIRTKPMCLEKLHKIQSK